MKALSIRQPWAWCIIHAGKDIENRIWNTGYRGPILIHAAKGMTRYEYEDCLAIAHRISITHPFPTGLILPAFEELDRGGLVGMADLVDVVNGSANDWFEGPFGFVLRNVKPLPFLPLKGRLGLFDVEYADGEIVGGRS